MWLHFGGGSGLARFSRSYKSGSSFFLKFRPSVNRPSRFRGFVGLPFWGHAAGSPGPFSESLGHYINFHLTIDSEEMILMGCLFQGVKGGH